MIVCPNCQTENRLGAIFCRGCGTKLAIDDVNVQNFEQRTGVVSKDREDKKRAKRRLIRNIIHLVFILLIAAAVFLVFQKPELPAITTSKAAFNKFQDKHRKLKDAYESNKGGKEEFTEEELNSFVADMVAGIESEGRVQLRGIFIDLQDDNKVKVYMRVDVFGQRIVPSISGTVSAGENGFVFKPHGFFAARMGKLPYPSILFKHMTKDILKKNEELVDFLNTISSVEVSEDKAEAKIEKE